MDYRIQNTGTITEHGFYPPPAIHDLFITIVRLGRGSCVSPIVQPGLPLLQTPYFWVRAGLDSVARHVVGDAAAPGAASP